MNNKNICLLNFHTGKYNYFGRCCNDYKCCSKKDAKKFIKSVKILNEYVILCSIHDVGCRIDLSDIEIKIVYTMNSHDLKSCKLINWEEISDSDQLKPEFYFNDKDHDASEMIEGDFKTFNPVYFYASIMRYCIVQTLNKLRDSCNGQIFVLNKIINKLQLYRDNSLLKEYDISYLKLESRDISYLWIDEKTACHKKAIDTINKLVALLKIARKHEEQKLKLVLSGFGELGQSKSKHYAKAKKRHNVWIRPKSKNI